MLKYIPQRLKGTPKTLGFIDVLVSRVEIERIGKGTNILFQKNFFLLIYVNIVSEKIHYFEIVYIYQVKGSDYYVIISFHGVLLQIQP